MAINFALFILTLLFSHKGLFLRDFNKLTPDNMIATFKILFSYLGTREEEVSNQIFCLKDFNLITESFNNIFDNLDFQTNNDALSKSVLSNQIKKLIYFMVNIYKNNKNCFYSHPENILNEIKYHSEDSLQEKFSTLERTNNFMNLYQIMEEIKFNLISHRFNNLGKNIAKLFKDIIFCNEEPYQPTYINSFLIFNFIENSILFIPSDKNHELKLCLSNNFMKSTLIDKIVENTKQRSIEDIIEFIIDLIINFQEIMLKLIIPCFQTANIDNSILNDFNTIKIGQIINNLKNKNAQINQYIFKLKKVGNLFQFLEEGKTFQKLFSILFTPRKGNHQLGIFMDDLKMFIFGFTNEIENSNHSRIVYEINQNKDLMDKIRNFAGFMFEVPFISYCNALIEYFPKSHYEFAILNFTKNTLDLFYYIEDLDNFFAGRYTYQNHELKYFNILLHRPILRKSLIYLFEYILNFKASFNLIEQRKFYRLGQNVYDFVSNVTSQPKTNSLKRSSN